MKQIKKSMLLILACLFAFGISLQAKDCVFRNVKVDEVFEYTSIVWRLAGATEYSDCNVDDYVKDIDRYFSPYKGHELIQYCRQIRESNSIGADAVPKAAAFLGISEGGVALLDGHSLEEICNADDRWTEDILAKYISLLDKFYKDSRFNDFFVQHRELYDLVEKNTLKSLEGKVDKAWFEDFYGRKFPDNLNLYICVNNGHSNYALTEKMPVNRQGLLSSTLMYGGLSRICGTKLSVVIHELNHRYVNPVVMQYKAELDASVGRLYPYMKDVFERWSYNEESVAYEWLASLFTDMYFDSQYTSKDDAIFTSFAVADNVERGIIWQQRAFDFMKLHFVKNRDEYRSIYDFMPQLVAFLDFTASEAKSLIAEYENRHPYVYDIFPLPGSELDLSGKNAVIEIRFSEDMLDNVGYRLVWDNAEAERKAGNAMKPCATERWKDKRTLSISLNCELVRHSGFKGIKLDRRLCQSERGYLMKQDYMIGYKAE